MEFQPQYEVHIFYADDRRGHSWAAANKPSAVEDAREWQAAALANNLCDARVVVVEVGRAVVFDASKE